LEVCLLTEILMLVPRCFSSPYPIEDLNLLIFDFKILRHSRNHMVFDTDPLTTIPILFGILIDFENQLYGLLQLKTSLVTCIINILSS
jgi:hypothetical protein